MKAGFKAASAFSAGLFRSRSPGAASAFARVLSTKSNAPPPHPFESFLSGTSGTYIEDMYAAWRQSPDSVHKSWQSVFARMDAGALPGQSFVPPPDINAGATLTSAVVPAGSVSFSGDLSVGQSDQVRVMQLIQAFQVRGHNVAELDPLGLYDADLDGATPPGEGAHEAAGEPIRGQGTQSMGWV